MSVGAGGLGIRQEVPPSGWTTRQLMSTTGHAALTGSRDLPSKPHRCGGTSPSLWVRGGRPREVKRLPKPIQPLRGRAGIEPRSSVPCLQASTGTPEGGGNEPWGARGDTGGRSHPYCEEQAPECRAKAKVGYSYQLTELSRDKWAAPGDGELPIKRGSEGSDAHVTHSQGPLSSVPATTPSPWLHEVPESLTRIPSVPGLSGILTLTGQRRPGLLRHTVGEERLLRGARAGVGRGAAGWAA